MLGCYGYVVDGDSAAAVKAEEDGCYYDGGC